MSQPVQPPGNQPVPPSGNPFADGAGAVPPAPFMPAPPPARVRNNIAGGVVAAVIAALVAALVYGWIIGLTEREIGWAALGVGALIGFAAGKVGGGNQLLAGVSALLALGAVYLGQIFGLAAIGGKQLNVSATSMVMDHFSVLTDAWSQEMDFMSFVFLALAAFAAFSAAKKTAE
ncbi:hypothetical protein [Streptomyces sp. NBC_00370]|uniref:hypothetical protein n=1 Tax=Streptomyces sp. NBC_00370 TaxID=2975728 RepID=UPI002E274275